MTFRDSVRVSGVRFRVRVSEKKRLLHIVIVLPKLHSSPIFFPTISKNVVSSSVPDAIIYR